MGYSFCRFECGIPNNAMGDSDLSDGEWLWPEGLAHYVERHSVRLPDEFIQTMRSHSWQVPAGLEFSPGAKRMVLKNVGYWFDPESDWFDPDEIDGRTLPHPRVLVAPGYYGEDLPRIVAYLRQSNYAELCKYVDEHKYKKEDFRPQEDISFWVTWAERHGHKEIPQEYKTKKL
jgi:hypothetical protein